MDWTHTHTHTHTHHTHTHTPHTHTLTLSLTHTHTHTTHTYTQTHTHTHTHTHTLTHTHTHTHTHTCYTNSDMVCRIFNVCMWSFCMCIHTAVAGRSFWLCQCPLRSVSFISRIQRCISVSHRQLCVWVQSQIWTIWLTLFSTLFIMCSNNNNVHLLRAHQRPECSHNTYYPKYILYTCRAQSYIHIYIYSYCLFI